MGGKLSRQELRAIKESKKELSDRIHALQLLAKREPVKLNMGRMFRNKGNKLINFIRKINTASKVRPFKFPLKFINRFDVERVRGARKHLQNTSCETGVYLKKTSDGKRY